MLFSKGPTQQVPMGTLRLTWQDGAVQKLLLVTQSDFQRLEAVVEARRRLSDPHYEDLMPPWERPRRRLHLVRASEQPQGRPEMSLSQPVTITLWAIMRFWGKTFGVTSREISILPWRVRRVELIDVVIVSIPA